MARDGSNQDPSSPGRFGDAALTCGVLALVFAFVPIVGDVVTVPTALAAVVLGVVGVVRGDQGLEASPNKAFVGVLLGVIAAFATFTTFAAMGTFE